MKKLQGHLRQRLGSLAAYGEHYHHEHEADAKVPTAASMGYMACRHCGAVWKLSLIHI